MNLRHAIRGGPPRNWIEMRTIPLSLILLLSGAAGAADKDTCFECHSVMEGMSEVFKDDVHYHNQLSCADCHGGDSKEEDQNLSMNASRGFKVRVKRSEVPEYCGRCHSDAAFMHKRNPKERVDQVALYRTSVHSTRLMEGSPHAPECVDCHGIHTIRAVSDPLSPANPAHVVEMCAKCHAAAAEARRTQSGLLEMPRSRLRAGPHGRRNGPVAIQPGDRRQEGGRRGGRADGRRREPGKSPCGRTRR